MKISKLKGFTLVELIIVVVIIGILAAISVVGYTGQANKARANSAYSALNEAVRAASVCTANGDTLTDLDGDPVIVGGTTTVCSSTVSTNALWPNLKTITNNVLDYDASDKVVAADGTIAIGVTGNLGGTVSISCDVKGCTKSGF